MININPFISYFGRCAKLYARPLVSHFSSSIAKESGGHASTYAICVGGGSTGAIISRLWKENLPECAEYYDLGALSRHLIEADYVARDNLSLFFGRGDVPPKVKTNSLFQRLMGKFTGETVSEAVTGAKFPVFHGAASLPNLEAEFDRLSKKLTSKDRLLIILSGHGSPSKGVILWNEYLAKEFLSRKTLEIFLNKFEQKPEITLVISSCYSGQYLPLTSRKISIVCTSSRNKVSYYSQFRGCEHLQRLFGCDIKDFNTFDVRERKALNSELYQDQYDFNHSATLSQQYENKTILQRNSKLAFKENYYATDSLSYFIHRNLGEKANIGQIDRAIETINYRLGSTSFKVSFILDGCLMTFIILDPTGILRTLANAKVALLLGKLALPFIKLVSIIVMPNLTASLDDKFKNSRIYREWFTLRDTRLLEKVKQLPQDASQERPQILTEKKEMILSILTELKQLKETPSEPNKPLLHYHYLYDKVQHFLSLASTEEIDEFLSIYQNLSQNKIKQFVKGAGSEVHQIHFFGQKFT